jgi:hypothetical protein
VRLSSCRCSSRVGATSPFFYGVAIALPRPKMQLSLSQPLDPDTAKKRNCCGNAAVTQAGLGLSLVTFLAGQVKVILTKLGARKPEGTHFALIH